MVFLFFKHLSKMGESGLLVLNREADFFLRNCVPELWGTLLLQGAPYPLQVRGFCRQHCVWTVPK